MIIDYKGNDIIPDDKIDELLRKSCADLQGQFAKDL